VPPTPGVSTFNARGDGGEQAHVAAGLLLRPLSGTELVEFQMTVDAAIRAVMQTSLQPSRISSTAFLMAAAAESRLRDNAPAESVPVMM
jgi:hypothetical protein